MSEGMIPVGSGDLPIHLEPLSESDIYTGSLDKVMLSPKRSKNGQGVVYCAIQVGVTEGDFEGQVVQMNYLPLPIYVHRDSTKKERIQADRTNMMFERFCRAYGIRGTLPEVHLEDAESIQAFKDLMDKHLGNTGKFTVQNQEFPEGSGRVRSSIRDFVF